MGHKTNPTGLRLSIINDWDYEWFATSKYSQYVLEDFYIKNYLRGELQRAGVARIRIKRKIEFIEVLVHVARPGLILGKNAMDMGILKAHLEKKTGKKVNINLRELKSPDLSSRLIADWICGQLERRVPFRRAVKMAVQRAQKAGAQGIKVMCSGRLGGLEIARSECVREGKVPLHTLRANIDYSIAEALTVYGKIGVQVWIYLGEVMPGKKADENILDKEVRSEDKRKRKKR